MLISPHSSSPRWINSNSGHYSSGLIKRKRSSCSSEEDGNSQGFDEKEGLQTSSNTAYKKSRRDDRNLFINPSTPNSTQIPSQPHISTPTPARHLPPLIPSSKNHFEQGSNTWGILNQHQNMISNKPPTIDEVRSWNNSSTSTPSTPFTSPIKSSSSSFLPSSPSRWAKVETSYGYKRVDLENHQESTLNGDEEMMVIQDEEMKLEEDLPSSTSSTLLENEAEFRMEMSMGMGSDSTMQMQLSQEEESINTPTPTNENPFHQSGLSSPPETYMVEGMSNCNNQGLPHLITPMSPGFPLSLNVSGKTGHPHPYNSWNVGR